jgi:hypothetical protein
MVLLNVRVQCRHEEGAAAAVLLSTDMLRPLHTGRHQQLCTPWCVPDYAIPPTAVLNCVTHGSL